LLNTYPAAVRSNSPDFNLIIADRCKIISRRVPAQRMNRALVTLKLINNECQELHYKEGEKE
jgi:hypothetical protein